MGSRTGRAFRGLAALVALAGALVAPPLALARFVGNPLPQRVPPLDEMVDGLARTGINDRTVIGVLAILAWIIWAQLALAVVAEIGAVAGRRPTRRLPVLPGLQPLAGQLVAAVLVLGSSFGAARTAAPPTPLVLHRAQPVAAVMLSEAPAPALTSSNSTRLETGTAAAPTETYLVQRHDTLWSIAEDRLGDGLRWREIRDLNVGRTQSDGSAVSATSDVIRPGWQLLVPASRSPAPSSGGRTHTVERGENLWQISEDTLENDLHREAADAEVDPFWREVIDLNRASLPDPSNPSLIFSGQQVALPPPPTLEAPPEPPQDAVPAVPSPSPAPVDPEPPTGAETAPSTPAAPTTQQPQDAERTPSADRADNASTPSPRLLFLGLAGGGLASGLALGLSKRRRDRQARAPIGHVVPPIPDDLREVHREIVTRGDQGRSALLQSALAELAGHAATHRSAPRPRLVQYSLDRIEVLLDRPDLDAPDGWTVEASGAVWTRASADDTDPCLAAAAPMLATIGTPADGVEILYDLEAAGVTVVSGDEAVATNLTRSIVLEVINSGLDVQLVLVGDDLTAEGACVRRASTWAEVADEVLAWAQQSAVALAANSLPTAFAGRGAREAIDGLIPMLVVLDEQPVDERFDEVANLVASGAACCVLIRGAQGESIGTRIHVSTDGLEIPSLGLECTTQEISAEVAEHVAELLDAADRPAEQMQIFEVPNLVASSSNGVGHVDPDYDVLVRVLGQIGAEGGHKPLTPRQLGVLTFITLHPGCSAELIEDAIWPDPMENRRRRLHVTLSQTRAALGAHLLPNAATDGTYTVGSGVRSDLELFRSRVTQAANEPAEAAAATLKGALQLVTGAAFAHTSVERRSFVWVDTEQWLSQVEAEIVKAAWEAWRMCSELGDIEGAIWAARQGLLASPTNTELTNALMHAYVDRGDTGTAEIVFSSHVRALDRLGLGEPEDSTLDLRESLGFKAPAAR